MECIIIRTYKQDLKKISKQEEKKIRNQGSNDDYHHLGPFFSMRVVTVLDLWAYSPQGEVDGSCVVSLGSLVVQTKKEMNKRIEQKKKTPFRNK